MNPMPATPRWGTMDRDRKAEQIFATVAHCWSGGTPLAETRWCDIGCGNGMIAATLAGRVNQVVGVDAESWPHWPRLMAEQAGLELREEPVARLTLAAESFDVVVCNQVYEHVDDPRLLIDRIHRLLKPGGLGYLAGPNLLFPIEPHVFWPFVHWLPRRPAQALMHLLGSRQQLDAYSASYWTLRAWLSDFDVQNALPFVVRSQRRLGRGGMAAKVAERIPERLIRLATPLSPGFVFILRKKP